MRKKKPAKHKRAKITYYIRARELLRDANRRSVMPGDPCAAADLVMAESGSDIYKDKPFCLYMTRFAFGSIGNQEIKTSPAPDGGQRSDEQPELLPQSAYCRQLILDLEQRHSRFGLHVKSLGRFVYFTEAIWTKELLKEGLDELELHARGLADVIKKVRQLIKHWKDPKASTNANDEPSQTA
jgi:hypothetical protein